MSRRYVEKEPLAVEDRTPERGPAESTEWQALYTKLNQHSESNSPDNMLNKKEALQDDEES